MHCKARHAAAAFISVAVSMVAATARAAPASTSCEAARFPPVVNLRFDNDLFGAKDQDQGYTNGVGLTLVSPNLVSYTDDPCLPRLALCLNRAFEQLQPDE